MEPEADAIVTEKPKRVLTEAQRLAFLKGREKRMANIEKKRLEKEELKAAAVASKSPDPAPSPVPPKPVLERQTAGEHDVIVDRIVERIKPLLVRPPTPPAPKPKRAYVRKPKEPAPIQSPPPPPPPSFVSPVKKFIWL